MDRQLPAWASVVLMAAISAVLLVSTHLITGFFRLPEGTLGKDSAQGEALPAAEQFLPLELAADTGLDNAYEGQAGGNTVGYAAQVIVKGYGGPIELVVGMDMKGLITGISVGGESFRESPGLGAKSKDPEFKNQFVGIAAPVGLNHSDATSSATESGDWSATAAPSADAVSGATDTGDWSATAAPTESIATDAAQADASALEASSNAIQNGDAVQPTVDASSGATESDDWSTPAPMAEPTSSATKNVSVAVPPTPTADTTSSATESGDLTEAAPAQAQGGSETPAPTVDAASSATESGDWIATAETSDDAVSGATQNSNASIAETPTDEAASTVDAISGATITSAAIVNGINQCMAYLKTLI